MRIIYDTVGIPVKILLLQMTAFDLVRIFYLEKLGLEQCLVHLSVFVQVFGLRYLVVNLGARREAGLILYGQVEDFVFLIKLIDRVVSLRVRTFLPTRNKSVTLTMVGLSRFREKLAVG
jgi:hypothetical protein